MAPALTAVAVAAMYVLLTSVPATLIDVNTVSSNTTIGNSGAQETDPFTSNNNNNGNESNLVRIVMADFAHVFPARESLDTNYLFGLNRLIEHLKLLLSPSYKFKDVRTNN